MKINADIHSTGLYATTYTTDSSHNGKIGIMADWRRYENGRLMWTVSGGVQRRAAAIGWAACNDPGCGFLDAPWPLHTAMILGENIANTVGWLHGLPRTAFDRLRTLIRRR